ncbi:cyclohexanone monooxygenase [Diplocarpon rosae]|nr:cyclohexanone monooxygenase [Diplocarpon rosae]
MLNKLRNQGLKVRIFEKGAASGGIWYWNCYPGARVDSDTPIYQLFDEELWKEFTFKERYAGWKELRRYFDHVEKIWQIKKDTEFHKHVDSAAFDESTNRWTVECADGTEVSCKWFVPCIGFASKKYTPPVRNLGDFQGAVYHTALWPQHDVSMKDKRVGIIGTGASGIQVAQEIGPKVKSLTVFLRTPNFCLPMRQHKLEAQEEQKKKESGFYEKQFHATRSTFSGFTYDFYQVNTLDETPEQREAFYEDLWAQGGFRFWLNTYKDMLFDQKANDEAYKFWRKKVLERIKDPQKAEILAPADPPHPWGTKRPSLEQCYYEVMSQDNVKILDVNKSPISEVTETGLKHQNGFEELDILVLATGFDSVTGSLAQLSIRGTTGGTIADHWKTGTRTSMGIAIPTFPNMFFLYGPQAPTAFSNGPSCTQFQAEFVAKAIKLATEKGITRLESTAEAEEDWTKRMHEKWDMTLFPLAKSWYQGANIPGRKIEPLNWVGGMPEYRASLDKSLDNDLQGWKYSTAKGVGQGG